MNEIKTVPLIALTGQLPIDLTIAIIHLKKWKPPWIIACIGKIASTCIVTESLASGFSKLILWYPNKISKAHSNRAKSICRAYWETK